MLTEIKSFLSACVGIVVALVCLLVAIVILPNYGDDRAIYETARWFNNIQPVLRLIEQNALKNQSLLNAANDIDTKNLQVKIGNGVKIVEITESGWVILSGGSEEQLLILIPSLLEEHVTWRCLGAPAKILPVLCNEGNFRAAIYSPSH
ncbi:MAG: hypothetical protein FWH15_00375 [Betaproteobacteria bacterium]|nr:hypothetical protein [Betaproteobacteria bacterium]